MKRPATEIGWFFALAIALVLALSFVPAIAQAPDKQLIKPVAECSAGRCVMEQKDYEALQKFHAERMAALLGAAEIIDQLQAQNSELLRALARDAAGCKGRRT